MSEKGNNNLPSIKKMEQLCLESNVTKINLDSVTKNIPNELTKNKVKFKLVKNLTDEQLKILKDNSSKKNVFKISYICKKNLTSFKKIVGQNESDNTSSKQTDQVLNNVYVSKVLNRICINSQKKSVDNLHNPVFKKIPEILPPKLVYIKDNERSHKDFNPVIYKKNCDNSNLRNPIIKITPEFLPPKSKIPKKDIKEVTSSEKPDCDENKNVISSGAFKKISVNHKFRLDEHLYSATPPILPLLSPEINPKYDMKGSPLTNKTEYNLHGKKIVLVRKKENIMLKPLKTLALENKNPELECDDKNLENLESLSTGTEKLKIVQESDNKNIENGLNDNISENTKFITLADLASTPNKNVININNYMNVNFVENLSESSTIDFDKLSKEAINEIILGDISHSKITKNKEVGNNDSENGTSKKFPIIVENNTDMETEQDKKENWLLKENEDLLNDASSLFHNFDCFDGMELDENFLLTNRKSNNFSDKKVKSREDRLKRLFLHDLTICLNFDAKGNLPLHAAIIEENIPIIHRQCAALKSRVKTLDINNKDCMTPLHLAIVSQSLSVIITVLLKNGASPTVVDGEGNNSIHLAAACLDVEISRKLIWKTQEEVRVLDTYNYGGLTPLMIAVLNSNYIIVEQLLMKGYCPNKKDQKSGRTALFHALEKNDERLVKLLLDHYADTTIENFWGFSTHDAVFELDVSKRIKKMVIEQRGFHNFGDNQHRRPKRRANVKNCQKQNQNNS